MLNQHKGVCISTTPSVSSLRQLQLANRLSGARLHSSERINAKFGSRSIVRAGIVFANLVVILAIIMLVAQKPQTTVIAKPALAASSTAAANPLDQVSSSDIALTVSRVNHLPETTAITNQVQTQAAETAVATAGSEVAAKPQVVETALKSSADIQNYVTQAGDTATSVARKFGVTSDSIRWSNNLNSDSIAAGTKLWVPPVNGIVYTVKAGDTADSLATKFKANKDQIIAYNDAELKGLTPGQVIIIPNAVQVAAVSAASLSAGSFPWGGSQPIYGYNGYDYGYCTWYVATQVAVPSNWGNASSWSYYASMSGWKVSGAPSVGSIAQTPYAAGGLGHVAIVDAVSPDGSQIQIRDMNGVAGWGHVGYSGWISTSTFQHYITP